MKRCYECMNVCDELDQVCSHCGHTFQNEKLEPFQLKAGTIVDSRFIIGNMLGYGGFGITYIGWDRILEKKVAIKEFMPMDLATRVQNQQSILIYSKDKEELFNKGKECFSQEAKKLAMFNDEVGVITVYHEFEENNTAYFVMEYVEGETLEEMVHKKGRFTSNECRDVAIPLLKVLSKVHEKGIIHRDISPDNIYISKNKKIKLLDFGAARSTLKTYSKSVSMIIKRGFASEEQYKYNMPIGPYSDVYSVAATMYFMLTGSNPQDAMERSDNEPFIPPNEIVDGIDTNLNNAIMNALILDYKQRTQTAEQFYQEIINPKRTKLKKVKERETSFNISTKTKVTFSVTSTIAIVLCVFMVFGIIDSNRLGSGIKKILAAEQTYTPGLLNLSYNEAKKLSEEAEVKVTVIDKIMDNNVLGNMVLNQNPYPGKIVQKGSEILVTVSREKQKVLVPDSTYMKVEDAKKILAEVNLNAKVEYVESAKVKEGCVVSQSLKANETTYIQDEIILKVAKANPTKNSTLQEDKYKGKQLKEVLKEMNNKQAYVVVSKRSYSNKKIGTILSSEVIREENQNVYVQVEVSAGEEKVVMPDIELMDEEQAKQTLRSMNLLISTTQKYNKYIQEGKVIEQDVVAGTVVKKKEIIKVVVNNEIRNQSPTLKEKSEKKEEIITKEWTNWTKDDFLRNNEKYEVEEKTQYAYYTYLTKENIQEEAIEGYRLINTKDTEEMSEWSSHSDYIYGEAPKDSETERYTKTEREYRYFLYKCSGTCSDELSSCYPFPEYYCRNCGSYRCNKYEERRIWNLSVNEHVKYTLQLNDGRTHGAVHWLGNTSDDWFYDENTYVVNSRYRKQNRNKIYEYRYKSIDPSEWKDKEMKEKPNIEIITRKVYRYRLK